MDVLRFRQFVLFVLLGCGQGLGSVLVLIEPREERPGAPLGLATAPLLSHKGAVLYCDIDRFSAAVYVEFQAFTSLGPFQRPGRGDLFDGAVGSREKVDVDFLQGRDRVGEEQ